MSQFRKNTIYHQDGTWASDKAKKEIEDGLKLLTDVKENIIAFAGSRRITENNRQYKHCKDVAISLGQKGYALMSGGGSGIMRAVNTGATEVGARSIGFRSEILTKEHVHEDIYTDLMPVHYFFTRRFLMLIKTDAYILPRRNWHPK